MFLAGLYFGGGGESADKTQAARPITSTTAPADTTTTIAVQFPEGSSTGRVTEVVDGDTFWVALRDGPEEKVRMIGINSPENGECFSRESAQALTNAIADETVILQVDRTDRDQYGRLLRYVWTIDGEFVNLFLVQDGYALANDYPPDTAYSAELEAAQQLAETNGVGIWAADACGSPTGADVRIVHIAYDAPGDDNQNLNGEWVDIRNHDAVAASMNGWVLKDESASHRYHFPPTFILQPNDDVRVYTGCGQDTTTTLYWCNQGSAVWNNSGDTGFLVDPNGNIVDTYPD